LCTDQGVDVENQDSNDLWGQAATQLRLQVSEAIWNMYFSRAIPLTITEQRVVLGVPDPLVKEKIEERFLGLLRSVFSEASGHSMEVVIDVDIDRDVTAAAEAAESATDNMVVHHSVHSIESAPSHTQNQPPPQFGVASFDQSSSQLAQQLPPHIGAQSPSQGPPADNVVDLTTFASQRPGTEARPDRPFPRNDQGNSGSAGSSGTDLILNPRYTFEDFVSGASNRFAHAACLSVAETPARSYNPLFIYGESGLGKSHLLQAIAHYVRQNYSNSRVRYVSTETFVTEFVDAIKTNTTGAFKRRYRDDCDVLLIDDIQFMEGKEGTQEEFFHTFNYLHQSGRQIVISSDRPPKNMRTLEDRLRSRFEWGLITDVQPPELETRLAILRKKADRERVFVPDDVLTFIATNIKDNIRELEGALNRVCAWASLNLEPGQVLDSVTVERRILGYLLSSSEPRPITAKAILEATAKMFDFSVEDLTGQSRRRPLVTARQVAMYVFRELTDFSYPMIGREFGGRDHTTVIHAVEKIAEQMRERRAIYDQVTELVRVIRSGQ
jgi:chromosomal replication initiator protein